MAYSWGVPSHVRGKFSKIKTQLIKRWLFMAMISNRMPGVGLMIRVVGFGSWGPEFESRSAVELIPGGVNSARHPSEVGKMSASMLVY